MYVSRGKTRRIKETQNNNNNTVKNDRKKFKKGRKTGRREERTKTDRMKDYGKEEMKTKHT